MFLDSKEEAQGFDPEEFFDCPRELLDRAYNRPRRAQLEDEAAVSAPDPRAAAKMERWAGVWGVCAFFEEGAGCQRGESEGRRGGPGSWQDAWSLGGWVLVQAWVRQLLDQAYGRPRRARWKLRRRSARLSPRRWQRWRGGLGFESLLTAHNPNLSLPAHDGPSPTN